MVYRISRASEIKESLDRGSVKRAQTAVCRGYSVVKYSSRRCSLDHGYSRDIGAEFKKAATRAPLLAGGAGAPREDRPHLCQFTGTTDLLGYDRHRGQAGPRPRCRSLGSPETAVDRQYRAKKRAPLVEQLKYRGRLPRNPTIHVICRVGSFIYRAGH